MLKRFIAVMLLASPLLAGDYLVHPAGYIPHPAGVLSRTVSVPPVTTTDLVLQYFMGDVGGTNNTIYTLDTSGNNYTGTVYQATWIASTNGLHSYYLFDAIDDRIIKSNESNLNPHNELTVSCWSRKDGAHEGGYGALVDLWNNTTALRSYYLNENNDYIMRFSVNSSVIVTDTVTNEWNRWNHWIGTFDNGIVRLYKNGNLVSTNAAGNLLFTNTTDNIRIGTHTTEGQFTWNGAIWGVEIHTNAFSVYEVQQTNIQQSAQLGLTSQVLADDTSLYSNCVLNVTFNNVIQDGSKQHTTLTTASAPTLVKVKSPSGTFKGDGAADFDGNANYVYAGVTNDFCMINGVTNQSWMGWFNPRSDGESNLGYLWGKKNKDKTSGGGYCYGSDETTDGLLVNVVVDRATDAVAVTTNRLPLNSWTHVAVIYNEDNGGRVKIYFNGILCSLSTDTQGAGNPTTDNLHYFILGNDESGARTFDGGVDEFMRFTNSLASNVVWNIYNSQTNLFF